MPTKKLVSTSRDRVRYEVKTLTKGIRQVDAGNTAELKAALTPLLGLDPYSTQAVAQVAHVERATVNGQGWSVRRLGVLSFVPDELPPVPAAKPKATTTSKASPKGTSPAPTLVQLEAAQTAEQLREHTQTDPDPANPEGGGADPAEQEQADRPSEAATEQTESAGQAQADSAEQAHSEELSDVADAINSALGQLGATQEGQVEEDRDLP